MPCTLKLLEESRIGVAVGKLRKHGNADVAGLAARIVRVWKKQVRTHLMLHPRPPLRRTARPARACFVAS